jgi:hypothetical protein
VDGGSGVDCPDSISVTNQGRSEDAGDWPSDHLYEAGLADFITGTQE